MPSTSKLTFPLLVAAALTFAPRAAAEDLAPPAQPIREQPAQDEDIYAAIDAQFEAQEAAATDDLQAAARPVDFNVISVVHRPSLAQQIAFGVGLSGLVVGTIAASGSIDEPTPGSLVLSGVSIGLGVVGFATAGVLELVDEDPVQVSVGIGSFGAQIAF